MEKYTEKLSMEKFKFAKLAIICIEAQDLNLWVSVVLNPNIFKTTKQKWRKLLRDAIIWRLNIQQILKEIRFYGSRAEPWWIGFTPIVNYTWPGLFYP